MVIFLIDLDNNKSNIYQGYHVPSTVLGTIMNINQHLLLHLSISILLYTNTNCLLRICSLHVERLTQQRGSNENQMRDINIYHVSERTL